MIKDLLPRFYNDCSNKNNELWDIELDWESENSIGNLLILFEGEIEKEFEDIDKLVKITTNFSTDVLALKQDAFGPVESLLMFIHFQSSTILIDLLEQRKLFNLEFDWIANSLSEELSNNVERNFELNWLLIFITNTNEYIQSGLIIFCSIWSRCLFYYSRVQGGHKELVSYYLTYCYGYLKSLVNATFFSTDLVMSFVQILGWANKNHVQPLQKDSVEILLFYYNIAGFPEDLKKLIALQFSCDGYQYTFKSRLEWCEIVEHHGSLFGSQKIQLTLNKYDSSDTEIIKNLDAIKTAIHEYYEYLAANNVESKYLAYELSRTFSLLEPAFVSLIKAGKISILNALIGVFFKIDSPELILNNNAVVLPGTISGTCYSVEGRVEYSKKDPSDFIPKITTSLNNFLSKTHTLNDLFHFTAERLVREHGIPKPELAHNLEKVLVDYYTLDDKKIKALLQSSQGYYLFNGTQIPLQSLFIKYCNTALPIIHSFFTPSPTKKLLSVLIWQGDTLMSERECDSLESLLKANDVNVMRLNFYSSSKEEFLGYYIKKEFDLIWISCHGEFKHFSPHDSYLILRQSFEETPEIRLSYDELKTTQIEKTEYRRLLVLNACDGATTSLNNNPTSIGIGASVINKHQSLLSHQWPVDNTAGLIHGILFIIFLLKHQSYLVAYKSTIKKFLEGKEAILNCFRECNILKEAIDGIEANNLDFSSFYYWGSLSYLE